MSIYFIADTHFGDNRIRKYESRPFLDVETMDSAMIENWNRIVSKDDTVYHLGDVGDISFVEKLNGRKYLIKGNHDTLDNECYRKAGFEEVYDHPIVWNQFWILSHEPMYVNCNMPYANLFGHVHNNPIYQTASIQSYCVCVERTNYEPVSLEQIKKVVAGDDYNDLEMLQECGIGVAVSNGLPSVKAVADHICESSKED